MKEHINGDMAMAHGAIAGGVNVITGYPGSPSSGTMDHLIKLQSAYNYKLEWSVNEKVAAEVAIGASIGGRRSLICVKSVGMNLMIDPLMALNLTPLNAGLVILLGDDPGGYGSQNDQDTRPIVQTLEIPLLEPASPEEGYQMMSEAFGLSEKYKIPVIIRETRAFSQSVSSYEVPPIDYNPPEYDIPLEPYRFVPVPANVVQKHKVLHQQLDEFKNWTEHCQYNQIIGNSKKGIITSGFAHTKLKDVLGPDGTDNFSILKLGSLYPLPEHLTVKFLNTCDEILVIEETLPFIENAIKVIAYDHRCKAKIHGKQSLHVPSEGELFRWHISEAIKQFNPEVELRSQFTAEKQPLEVPSLKSNCEHCRYEEVLEMLDKSASNLDLEPIYTGDPGCLFKVGDRLLAKYSIGSAVALASGLKKSGNDRPVVSLIGDSGFFHTTIPAIINASYNRSKLLMVLLDNEGAITSGFQPTPAMGVDVLGKTKPALDFTEISKACGVRLIQNLNIDDPEAHKMDACTKAFQYDGLSMLIVKIPNQA